MINFEQLVERLICEAAGFVSTDTDFRSIMQQLKAKFDGFNDGPEDSQFDAFKTIVQQRGFTRTAPKAIADPFMSTFFPLVDLLCLVNEKYKANTNSKNNMIFDKSFPGISGPVFQAFKDVQASFESNLSKFAGPGLDPIAGYTNPVSGTMKGFYKQILSEYLGSGIIGKKALENFIKNNYTLIQAIMHIAKIRKDTRTIFTRTKVLPVVDNNIKSFFWYSEDYAPGASPSSGVFAIASRNPKQIPALLTSIGAENIFLLADLIKTYAFIKNPPPVAPSGSSPNPKQERENQKTAIDLILNKKVDEIAKDQSTPEAAQIIAQLLKQSDYEPGKKNYAGLQTGMAKIASAATGGVQFGK